MADDTTPVQSAPATVEPATVQELHSTIHAVVTCAVDDVPYTIAFPARVGDADGETPRAVADVLIGLSFLPGEYVLVEVPNPAADESESSSSTATDPESPHSKPKGSAKK